MKFYPILKWRDKEPVPPFIAPTVDVEIQFLEETLFGFSFLKVDPWFVTTA